MRLLQHISHLKCVDAQCQAGVCRKGGVDLDVTNLVLLLPIFACYIEQCFDLDVLATDALHTSVRPTSANIVKALYAAMLNRSGVTVGDNVSTGLGADICLSHVPKQLVGCQEKKTMTALVLGDKCTLLGLSALFLGLVTVVENACTY